MKILIAYATRTGTTEKAARLLAKEFPRADVVNIEKEKPDPKHYEAVIIGSPIRTGRILRSVRTFIEENRDILREKKTAIFICNVFLDQAMRILKENFSVECRNCCVTVDSFGGEMHPEKAKGFDRVFARAYLNYMWGRRKGESVEPVLLTDRIKIFAQKVKDACAETI